ncbi:MAG: two-component system response regulator [Acidobacteria bacterium]|nr:MAG: two-component system response regulator [Acidobacteriota bacterium]
MQCRRILLADDENDIREIAGATLEVTADWQVLTATCGKEALEMARENNVDAILLDVMMPDMDGLTTFTHLRAAANRTPVIFLTAKVQTADRQRYTRLGISGVIAKPFDPMSLARTIMEILGW